MKKFFRFGKGKKDGSDTVSNTSSWRGSTSSIAGALAVGGYDIRDKDLGKIHKAVLKKNLDKVKRLASKEANAVDKEARTALHLASAIGYDAAIQELLQWKANVNAKDKENKTPLYKAIENRQELCARTLLSARADPSVKDREGNSSLHCAAREGMFDLVQAMISKCSRHELSHPNSAGLTPLHLASGAKNLSICKLLLENGVNIDAQDSKGFTPLMVACQTGNHDLVSMLLELNADTSIKEANGWTADDIALNSAQPACRDAILRNQSRPPAAHRESHLYSTLGSDDDEAGEDVLGKPVSNVEEATSDDDNATDNRQASAGHASEPNPKDWSDSESESELEVKNKNKGFIYNNMAKNLNALLGKEADEGNSAKQTNHGTKVIGLPPPSPGKALSTEKTGNISPRSWNSNDSHTDSIQPSKTANKLQKEQSRKTDGKKKVTEESSDDEWESELSQPSQNLQPAKTQALQQNLTEIKPDNRQKAAAQNTDDIYAAVNKKTNEDKERMMDELGLEDVDIGESEVSLQTALSLHSPDKTPRDVPASARSGCSDWDTTAADVSHSNISNVVKVSEENKAKSTSKDEQESDSRWDSDEENHEIPDLPGGIDKGNEGKDVTEDEEESTWEKERKRLKKGMLEKQKAEDKVDYREVDSTKPSPVKNGEKKKDNAQLQQEIKERAVDQCALPPSTNKDPLNLSSASKSSFKPKDVSTPSIATLASRFSSQDESVSEETDDPFSPRSTVRSILLNTDMSNVIRLQEMIRDGQQKLESERSSKALLEAKRKALENERAKLLEQLQVVTREKFNLDQLKIDLESKVRHLEYQFSEEVEKRKNTDVLYEKTKEQLMRKEEQFLKLTEDKQKTETLLRNEQKERNSVLAVVKQLEDENQALKRQLNEKNIFIVQDDDNAVQQKNIIQSRGMVSGEGFQLMPSVAASAEIYAAQLEINRQKERAKDEFEQLMHENEELTRRNKELTEKWSLGEDALTHASLHYNLDVVKLKVDNDQLVTQLGKETATKEDLLREVNSLNLQLSSLKAELRAALDRKAEIERQHLHNADDWNRLSEKQQQELSSSKSLCQSQSAQLSEVLKKLQKLESELMVANTMLTERTSQLTTLQKDSDKRRSSNEALDENFQKVKEENIRLEAKVESLQERLNETQEELRGVKQMTKSKHASGEQPDDLATLLSSFRAEHDWAKVGLEERNASLTESVSKLKEELKVAERSRVNAEDEKRRLQTSLGEIQKQLLAAEATHQISNQSRQQLEVERSQLKAEIEQLKDKLEDDRQKILHLEQRILELTQQLKMAERSAASSCEQLNKESSSLQGLLKVKHDLEGNLHRMEIENAKLEAGLTHERQRVEMLQKDYNESRQTQSHLEDEYEKLKSSNAELQYMMNEAAGLKTQATLEADDNRALWESEIKSRSKLGLRLAQLEREKRELDSKVQEEKRRVKRALELKKSTEEKLEEERGRNSQLVKEIATLKVHLKTAKKRLKEHQTVQHHVSNSQQRHTNGTDSEILDIESGPELIRLNSFNPKQAMEIQMELDDVGHELDFAKHQFQYGAEARQMRQNSYGLLEQDQMRNVENIRMNGSVFHHDRMPQKFQTVGSNYLAVSEIDQIREKLKSEAQMELNQKLQEVNRYLDEQAKAREKLDRIRDINETEMRLEFEKVRKEMLEEIAKVKQNFEGQKGGKANEAQHQMKELYEREVKLHERLLSRLDSAYSKVPSSTIDYLQPNVLEQEDGILRQEDLTKVNIGHGLNDSLMNNLRNHLDRSIARHLATAADDHADFTLNTLHLDTIGTGRKPSNGDATTKFYQNFLL